MTTNLTSFSSLKLYLHSKYYCHIWLSHVWGPAQELKKCMSCDVVERPEDCRTVTGCSQDQA